MGELVDFPFTPPVLVTWVFPPIVGGLAVGVAALAPPNWACIGAERQSQIKAVNRHPHSTVANQRYGRRQCLPGAAWEVLVMGTGSCKWPLVNFVAEEL